MNQLKLGAKNTAIPVWIFSVFKFHTLKMDSKAVVLCFDAISL